MGSCENSEANNMYLEQKSFNCLPAKRCFGWFCLYSQTIDRKTARLCSKCCFLCLSFLERWRGWGVEWVPNNFIFLNAKKFLLKNYFGSNRRIHKVHSQSLLPFYWKHNNLMVARGAGKNEATVAESRLGSEKKKMAKKNSTTRLFSLIDFVLVLLI